MRAVDVWLHSFLALPLDWVKGQHYA